MLCAAPDGPTGRNSTSGPQLPWGVSCLPLSLSSVPHILHGPTQSQAIEEIWGTPATLSMVTTLPSQVLSLPGWPSCSPHSISPPLRSQVLPGKSHQPQAPSPTSCWGAQHPKVILLLAVPLGPCPVTSKVSKPHLGAGQAAPYLPWGHMRLEMGVQTPTGAAQHLGGPPREA